MPYLCANGQISLRFIIQCASLSDQLALLPRAKRGRRFQWSGTNLADRAPTILDRTLHTDKLCSALLYAIGLEQSNKWIIQCSK